MQILPIIEYQSLLDVCCGVGRHSIALAQQGYTVTGIDINNELLEKARVNAIQRKQNVTYIKLDTKDLGSLEKQFDGIIIMWQSFGQFNKDENREFLRNILKILKPNGKMILDIYNRDFFDNHLGTRTISVENQVVRETKTMTNDRLKVQLEYDNSDIMDIFEWEIFYPDEILDLCEQIGFSKSESYSDFNWTQSTDSRHPRMQIVASVTDSN
jgi:ubiquinone/menaquinone biosynthesis C-methylase UbiE